MMGTEVIRVPLDYDGPTYHEDIRDKYGTRRPPEGSGYALWQNTSDVMFSPVFPSLRELCDWAANVYDDQTSDEWYDEMRGWVNE